MIRAREWLAEPWIQRGVRAALAAGLAWQAAVFLPAPMSNYAYYAALGAVIAVHPTVADSASAAWRTVLAILLGFTLAVVIHEATIAVPAAVTIALVVGAAVVVEQWRVLREHASWVSFAAVLMFTVGADDPAGYAVNYAGLTLLGAAIGVLVTTVLFPPLQLTVAVRRIAAARGLLARHLRGMADGLRNGEVPSPGEWEGRGRELGAALDRMRAAENVVARARRANPRARKWVGTADRIREQSRALDRVAVLVDDLTTLVVEFQPHRRGIDRIDGGTGWVLADALDSLGSVVCNPYPTRLQEGDPDDREAAIEAAEAALHRLTTLLRSSDVADDEGFFALGAVTVGMHRALDTLRDRERTPLPA
ncbi:aromatic acid exporter family protein [Blastococcus sp. LR1]|uniref:FUSC family protein n=1 Tax=Blastococcus sp. LR1 TaxID=2877000 RepID=UPI001CCD9979|nr:aromatic acid exporter family protein [Blastococcus sp. LR1]MCA0146670.1 aromatic acid exporter family protein [Blastococcus sp. LR1]